jgi:NAD(P)H dehydrogenase (quinone)
VNVLVVYTHPDPESFAAAMRDRVLAGLRAGGHAVQTVDLYADGFDPILSDDERRDHHHPPARRSQIDGYAAQLRWAHALVFVYPTWWSGQPAMLKGWFDRVWTNGVAYELVEGRRRPKPRLGNIRTIVTVTSHGSPKYTNAIEGEAGKRLTSRGLRPMCSRRTRVSWISLYNIDRLAAGKRTAFLDRVEARMRRL